VAWIIKKDIKGNTSIVNSSQKKTNFTAVQIFNLQTIQHHKWNVQNFSVQLLLKGSSLVHR